MKNEKNLIKCQKCGSLTNKYRADCSNCGEPIENSRKAVISENSKTFDEIDGEFDLDLKNLPGLVVSSVIDDEENETLTPVAMSSKVKKKIFIKKVLAFLLPQFMLALYRKYIFLAITLALFIISAVLPSSDLGSIGCVFVLFLSSRIGLSVISSKYKESEVVFTSSYSESFKSNEPIFKDADKKTSSSKNSKSEKQILSDYNEESSSPQTTKSPTAVDKRENHLILALIMLPFSIISIMLLINRFLLSIGFLISFLGFQFLAVLLINIFLSLVRMSKEYE